MSVSLYRVKAAIRRRLGAKSDPAVTDKADRFAQENDVWDRKVKESIDEIGASRPTRNELGAMGEPLNPRGEKAAGEALLALLTADFAIPSNMTVEAAARRVVSAYLSAAQDGR